MKISISNILLIALAAGFMVPVTAAGDTGQELTQISAQLGLTDNQALEVGKILKMTNSQAAQDRENFKGNARGLIEMARQRRRTRDQLIFRLLDEEQKHKFFTYMKKKQSEEELFLLTEGLMLTGEQLSQVKRILNEFREKWNRQQRYARIDMDEMMYGGGMTPSGGYMPGGGMLPNGGMTPNSTMMPGAGMRNSGSMRRVPRGMQDRLLQDMRAHNDAKAKKIKKILTPEQKKLYKYVLKLQDKELEEAFKRMSPQTGS